MAIKPAFLVYRREKEKIFWGPFECDPEKPDMDTIIQAGVELFRKSGMPGKNDTVALISLPNWPEKENDHLYKISPIKLTRKEIEKIMKIGREGPVSHRNACMRER